MSKLTFFVLAILVLLWVGDVEADLVAHYTFDDGTADNQGGIAGAAANGTLEGGATIIYDSGGNGGVALDPLKAESLVLDVTGAVDYVDCGGGNGGWGDLSDSNIVTLAAWYKVANGDNENFAAVVSKGIGEENVGGWALQNYRTNGDISFQCDSNPDWTGLASTDPTAWNGQWHHAVGVFRPEGDYGSGYEQAISKIYVDGVLWNSSQRWADGDLNALNVIIGGNDQCISIDGKPYWRNFDGYIDDVRIYDEELDADEIYELFVEGVRIYVDDDGTGDPGPGNPGISDPLEDGSKTHPFDDIQEGINAAGDGYTVEVQPGLYEPVSPPISFGGKIIKLTGSEPTNPSVINETIISGTIGFAGSEDANCMLMGLRISDIEGGGIYGNHTQATISHCIINGNGPCGATVIKYWDGTINNCLIADNSTIWGCEVNPVILGCDGLIKNCTIVNNISGIFVVSGDTLTMENCIVYGNAEPQIRVSSSATLNISYCDLQGGAGGIVSSGDVNWGLGNIDNDPCFVMWGYWDYDPSPGEFSQGDYHLRSMGWRWREEPIHGSHWMFDDQTSRCIDSGNPGSPLSEELMTVVPEDPYNDWGVNLRINMGAYGRTYQASMAPYDWAFLGDLNNDRVVDWTDLSEQIGDWLVSDNEQPGDLNRDGIIDFVDFAKLSEDWLEEAVP